MQPDGNRWQVIRSRYFDLLWVKTGYVPASNGRKEWTKMKVAKILAWLGLLSMTSVLIYGFTAGNFSQDGAAILANPWGVVSLVDLYVGFTLFSIWIVYREKSWARSLVWVILMMVLGFFTGALYMLVALYTSGGDWNRFWLGNRHTAQNQE
jgi:hypothetical protein